MKRYLFWILLFLGACWGIPWIHTSKGPVHLFPVCMQGSLLWIFPIGIVITVGADGIWLMRKFYYTFFQIKDEAPLYVIVVSLLASLTCISPIYAVIHYNVHYAQYFAMLLLPVTWGGSFVGYMHLSGRLKLFSRPRVVLDYVQIVLAAFIAFSSVSISFYLTYEFFFHIIRLLSTWAMMIAFLVIIPDIVMSFLGIHFTVGRLLCGIFKRIDHQVYRPKIVTFILFLICLTSPTAGGYITFTTLGREHVYPALQWSVTFFVMLARCCFSFFTLSDLLENFFFLCKRDWLIMVRERDTD